MTPPATGEFGGDRRPAEEGFVSFEVLPDRDGGWEARGGETDFDGVGEGDTPALAIADYCVKYQEARDERDR